MTPDYPPFMIQTQGPNLSQGCLVFASFPRTSASCAWEVFSHLSVRVPDSTTGKRGRLPFLYSQAGICGFSWGGGGSLVGASLESGIAIFWCQTGSSLNNQGREGNLTLAVGRSRRELLRENAEAGCPCQFKIKCQKDL